ncbi:MAG TPA: hypothetical protein VGE52_02290 [Pirellulales bacterium]
MKAKSNVAAGRGRWQFTLRGALVVLVLATIPLALVGRRFVELRRQERVSETLARKGVAILPGAVAPSWDATFRRIAGAAEAPPQAVYGGMEVVDADLLALAEMPTVEVVSLIGASITDDGLAPLAQLKNLKALYLGNTAIGDAGLAHLRGLPALIEIHLHDTQMTDAGLLHLATLPALQAIYMARTNVTDEGVAAFEKLRPNVATFR